MPAGLGGRRAGRSTRRARCSCTTSRRRGRSSRASASSRRRRRFWERWRPFFDERDVRTPDGALRIVYVTEDTGVGGGHRDIFQHLNGLAARGHDVELWSLGEHPDWFDLDVPTRTFDDYDELVAALEPRRRDQGGDLVGHRGAGLAGLACGAGSPSTSCRTSRRPTTRTRPTCTGAVLASYRQEFRYLTISGWVAERLRELGLDAAHRSAGARPGHLPPAASVDRRDEHGARARPHEPAQEPAAHPRRVASARPTATGRSCGCSASSPSSATRTARATSSGRATPRSTSCSTRPPCSCRPRATRASACRCSRRWRPGPGGLHRRPRQP